MKWFMLLIVLSYSTVNATQESTPPYLYYYSSALNAIVVERADGSDSRTLAERLTPIESDQVRGPGWSPDGQWLAWYGLKTEGFGNFSTTKAVAVRVDNLARLKSLDFFSRIEEMFWSPDSRYLFVRGKTAFDSGFRPTAFWLIDMTTDSIAANIDIFTFTTSTPMQWQLDHHKLILYVYEEYPVGSNIARITLQFDGTVLKESVSQADYDAAMAALIVPDDERPYDAPLSSPSGHYVVKYDNNGVLTDAVTKLNFVLPLHSDSAGLWPMDVRWHPAEVWALFGYQRCFTDCSEVGGASVVNVVAGTHRELSQCGFGEGCIGWLPEQVDVSRLPKGQAKSVLPAPINYNYDVQYSTGVDLSKLDPLLTCDPATDKHFHILDPKTRETIFILRTRPDCETKMEPWPIAFARSPDGKLYALTNAIYNAYTDELLARFNTYGWELAFSADSSQLSMRSVNARMVWNMQELLDAEKRVRLLARYFQP